MLKHWVWILVTISLWFSCSNSKREQELNGLWKGKSIHQVGDSVVHEIQSDIEFVFDKPDYSFNNANLSEQGQYRVVDDMLELTFQEDSISKIRQIEIFKFSGDSLGLLLKDSLEQKKVIFIKQ
ncbi:hypothetical protein [Membranihabitans marinus]|uniref:hypothetical protein n=1 Tax=Membranihabitans marinus TaxID=1227546 RepID=UPI001F38483E|nr:hypothetical protein [Membranihabitans marinus]